MLIRNSAQGPQSQLKFVIITLRQRVGPSLMQFAALPYRKSVLQPVCLGPGGCLSLPVTGRGGSPTVGDLQPKKGNNQQPEEESWLIDDLADRLAVSPKFKNSKGPIELDI